MLNPLYNRYGKRVVRVVLGVVATIIIIAVYFALNSSTADAPAETKKLPEVTVQSVKELEETGTFSVVGTVRAVSEAKLQAEAGGRITAVNVKIGDAVIAGTILGSIENNSERAQLLQAEGAYESALASSLQGRVSLDEAKVGVRNTYRDTYSTIDAIIRNLTDDFFQNPSSSMRGFRLTGTGKTEAFNEARGDIEVILTTLAQHIANNHAGKTEQDMLTEIEDSVNTVNNFTSGLALIISEYDANTSFTESDLATYKTRLAGARASLDGALATISRTRQTYEQAVLSGSTETSSQSSAGLKIALGALRSAQVNYEKTLIRTPISGVVNTLNLTTGEFISQGQPAAIVANNGSLEVSTALSEKDLFRIHIGDTVMVNTTVAGTISQIAPAIDPVTGKGEVKISIANGSALKNGSTVSVAFTHKNDSTTASSDIIVPLKSLKMLASGSVAFGVDENNTLKSLPVVLGAIQGDSVEITEGLTLETEIVTDARGLKEGDEVIVIRK
jgi:RND family efflux transporter MFP subunit